MTNGPRTDGFGAQYAALVSVYAFCRATPRPFCGTPWTAMEHRANASLLWSLVGAAALGPRASALSEPGGPFHARLGSKLAPGVVAAVRGAYYGAPKPPLQWYSPGAVHVAVHVRRGDICTRVQGQIHHCTDGRFSSNGVAARCALRAAQRLGAGDSFFRGTTGSSGARPTLQAHNFSGGEGSPFRAPAAANTGSSRARPTPQIHIFSEGEPSDFGPLGRIPGFQSHFHLNAPLHETFHHMVSAQALVLARSSLSDMAALLSDGLLLSPEDTPGGGQIHYMHGHKEVSSC